MSTYYSRFPSPIGELTILSDGEAVTGIHFDYTVQDELPGDGLSPIQDAAQWLTRYFAGEKPDPGELTLRPEGTAFQRLVWSMLLKIPYGSSVTYGALAREAAAAQGRPKMSAQAIGGAVGRNPIVIAIPCHRVLGTGNRLTGFSAGIERKIHLLRIEGIPFQE